MNNGNDGNEINDESDFSEYAIEDKEVIEDNTTNVVNINGTPFDLEKYEKLLEKHKTCRKLILEVEDNLPTDLLILAYNQLKGRFSIYTSSDSVGEMLHMMEVAKTKMMNGQ